MKVNNYVLSECFLLQLGRYSVRVVVVVSGLLHVIYQFIIFSFKQMPEHAVTVTRHQGPTVNSVKVLRFAPANLDILGTV